MRYQLEQQAEITASCVSNTVSSKPPGQQIQQGFAGRPQYKAEHMSAG